MGQRSNGRGKAKRKIWGAFEKKWVREATDGGKPRGRFGERLKKNGSEKQRTGEAKRKIWGAIEKNGSEKQRTGESQEEDVGSV